MEDPIEFVKVEVKEEPMDHQGSSSHFPSSSGVDGVRSRSGDVKEEEVWIKDEPFEEVDPKAVNTTTFTPKPESTRAKDSAQHKSKPHTAEGSTAPLHVTTAALPQETATDQDDSGSDSDEAAELGGESSVGGCTMESGRTSQSVSTKPTSSGVTSTKKRGMKRDRNAVASQAPTTMPPDEEYEAASPPAPGQSPPHEAEETEEAEDEHQEQQQQQKEKKQQQKKKQPHQQKKNFGWSLSDETEQELVEWLQANTYLWLRSTKDYHRKKAAWEQKAQELNITLKHLQNWWKNVKDWFVKLSKKTSGQATRALTERDKWILKNVAFYKRMMTTDVPDTLGSLVRDQSLSAGSAGSASPVAGPSTSSQAQDLGDNVLEDMELAAAKHATATTTTTTRSTPQRKTSTSESQEEAWMAKLQANMEANQLLLQQVLQERAQPLDKKDAFLMYLDRYMRAAPEHEFRELQLMFYDRICRPLRTAPPPPPPPPPAADTATLMLSPGKQQPSTYYQFPGFTTPSPQWQQFGMMPPVQQQQQQQQLQPLSTPLRTRSRESSETVSRLLASTLDDWSPTPGPSTRLDD